MVESTIVLELKTVKEFDDVHFAIVKSYLRATKRKHGLLFNFAKGTFEVKRVIDH
jgi:GxxExxY protein